MSNKLYPAVFLDPRTGSVVKEGCESSGVTMTMDGEWYVPVWLGMWVYIPKACISTPVSTTGVSEGGKQ